MPRLPEYTTRKSSGAKPLRRQNPPGAGRVAGPGSVTPLGKRTILSAGTSFFLKAADMPGVMPLTRAAFSQANFSSR